MNTEIDNVAILASALEVGRFCIRAALSYVILLNLNVITDQARPKQCFCNKLVLWEHEYSKETFEIHFALSALFILSSALKIVTTQSPFPCCLHVVHPVETRIVQASPQCAWAALEPGDMEAHSLLLFTLKVEEEAAQEIAGLRLTDLPIEAPFQIRFLAKRCLSCHQAC